MDGCWKSLGMLWLVFGFESFFFLVCTDNLRSKDASGYVELLQSELGWARAGTHSFCMLCNSWTDVGLLSFQDSPDVQMGLEHKAMEAGHFARVLVHL